MSVSDVLTRVDVICKKYERYTRDKEDEQPAGRDPFRQLLSAVDAEIESLIHKSMDVTLERNKAKVAALKADIRRAKEILAAEIDRLRKLAQKQVKGVSKEELSGRPALVEALAAKLQLVEDDVGAPLPARPTSRKAVAPLDFSSFDIDAITEHHAIDFYKTTEESTAFKQEFKTRAAKQDDQLDYISAGLEKLRNMAQDMAEEMDRQDPLIDQMQLKVEDNTATLRSNNRRMKELLLEVRSTRKICIDFVLIIVLLGVGAYLYKLLKN